MRNDHVVSRTTVYCCEDDSRTRRLLAKIIETSGELQLAGQSGSAEGVLDALRGGQLSDVLLLDLELPGMQGMDLLARLDPPPSGPEVLILTSFADEERVVTAMKRGAAGYLVKANATDRLVESILEVAAGGTVIEPRLARRFWNLFQASMGRAERDPFRLETDEREVLELMAKGLTNPELGSVLGTGRRNIKMILERLYEKMGVDSRVEAVVEGFKAGLIQL
jgi:DNA-binding NarL/FixJ family response regulator